MGPTGQQELVIELNLCVWDELVCVGLEATQELEENFIKLISENNGDTVTTSSAPGCGRVSATLRPAPRDVWQ